MSPSEKENNCIKLDLVFIYYYLQFSLQCTACRIDLYHAYGIFSLELVFIITCVATAAMAAQSVISLLLLSCSLQIRLFYYVLAASSIVILHNQSC